MNSTLKVVLTIAAICFAYMSGFSNGIERGKRLGIDATIAEVERQVSSNK